ncbi:MAG: hypothetical protein ACK56F_31550 [bacterium]
MLVEGVEETEMEKFGIAVKEILEKHVNCYGDLRETLSFYFYSI